jgi:hypothetical protein
MFLPGRLYREDAGSPGSGYRCRSMRVFVIATAVVVAVVGGFWLVLAFAFSHSSGGADAVDRSTVCVRADPELASDPALAKAYRSSGLHALGIRWKGVKAVALFSDSLSPGSVDSADARIVAALERGGVSPSRIAARLFHEDNLSLYYATGVPSEAAQAAIGRCVYLVHYNRIASAFGLYVSPHARTPFLPGEHRGD